MATLAAPTTSAADTRQRLIEVAVDLFTRHSFAGTSLQMIADEMGFTKAAIYYHFRTREELLAAVVEPIFEQLSAIITAAESERSAESATKAIQFPSGETTTSRCEYRVSVSFFFFAPSANDCDHS